MVTITYDNDELAATGEENAPWDVPVEDSVMFTDRIIRKNCKTPEETQIMLEDVIAILVHDAYEGCGRGHRKGAAKRRIYGLLRAWADWEDVDECLPELGCWQSMK